MAEYIVDTTEGVLNARTTGELVRCGECLHAVGRDADGLMVCDFWSSFCGGHHIVRRGRVLLRGGAQEDGAPWHARLGRPSR